VTPFDGGATVTEYRVLLLDNVGANPTEVASCYGSDSVIMAALHCEVPMATFTASPFSYAQGDLLTATVEAYNLRGWSTPSDVNTATDGAKAQVAPH